MKVIDIIKKYGLEDFDKNYKTQYGNYCNMLNLDALAQMEVKSININFPTQSVEITILQY